MSLLAGFQTSMTGMKVAQQQLDIIGRNVANVDTPGYTRKYAQQKNVILAGQAAGVALSDINRSVNEGLLKSFLAANQVNGSLNAKSQYLSKTEVLLGTPEGDNSISANVADLQTAFNTFATDVTSAAGRYGLLNSADTVASRLNYLSTEIQKLRGDADLNIKESVDKINTTLDTLASLNDKIVKYTVLGYDGVADLEDQRDEALRTLSGLIDITYFKRESGEMVIQTSDGIMLLDRDPHKLSHNAVSQASATTTYAGGGISGIFVDGVDITNSIRDGEIKGLIEVRDVTLPSLQSQLDELAGVLKEQINMVHNQGTAYPNTPSSLNGTRDFIDPNTQRIAIEDGDVRITIFDSAGKEVTTTNLGGGLGFTNGTIANMTQRINAWLTDPAGANLPQASASIDKNGNFVIDTGDSEYTISIMDEASSTKGSGQTNATIKFDANGDGSYDRSFEGFSNFLGLNDFFTSTTNEAIYDSKVVNKDLNLGVRNVVSWGFSDTTNGINYGSINIYPNDSLQDIVNKINSDPVLNQQLQASLVPNGNGYVLRIVNSTGEQLEINENVPAGGANSGLIEKLGLKPSNAGLAGSIQVRSDLKTSPTLIANGSPEFDSSTGEYRLNPASNNIANGMAEVFTASQAFDQSGTLSSTSTTLANYAATFVGNIASASNAADTALAYQQDLTNSISLKEAQVSGVDMDYELSQLIIFQQSYAACAQMFTASKEILDMLLNMVK